MVFTLSCIHITYRAIIIGSFTCFAIYHILSKKNVNEFLQLLPVAIGIVLLGVLFHIMSLNIMDTGIHHEAVHNDLINLRKDLSNMKKDFDKHEKNMKECFDTKIKEIETNVNRMFNIEFSQAVLQRKLNGEDLR